MGYIPYNIQAGKWTTIGWSVGLIGRRLYWKVATKKTCSWRRISFAPWGGTFVGSRSSWLVGFWAVIQIKCPERTQAAASFNEGDLDLVQF
jgi:hypothetical protein